MANDMDLEPGFDDDNDRNDRRSDRSDVVRVAREKVSTPATLLIVASVVMFGMSFFGIWLNFLSGIDLNVKMFEFMRDNVNDQKIKADMQKEIDKRNNIDPTIKTAEKGMNAVFSVIAMVGNTLVLMAGLMMKKLKAWGLCLTGSIFAIILNGCCCIGLPIGIWALIVLSNRDVKAGFDAVKRMG
jgi:hypothetical protein